MSALAPCPFCGGDNGATAYTRDGRFAFCPDCGASSRRAFNGRVDQPSAEERAIAAWNTRARTPLEAELLAEAFTAGAMAVHEEWKREHEAGRGPHRWEPDFSEAASDYASLAKAKATP